MPSTDLPSSREASTASLPRGLPSLCHQYGECVCRGTAEGDAARTLKLDDCTRDRLAHARHRLHECTRILRVEEAARRALAISGPQTGRERRRRQMAARWIAKQGKAVRVLAGEVDALEALVDDDRDDTAQADYFACGVM